MVAQGLGVTVLPDHSVIGDPLERRGEITTRPLAEANTRIGLVLQGRPTSTGPGAVQDLHRELVRRSAECRRPATG